LAEEIKKELAKDNTKYRYVFQNIEAIGVINKRLHDIVERRSKEKDFILTLGGDHGIASGSIHGLQKTYGEDLKVIWVDAHGDATHPDDYQHYHGMPTGHLLGWLKKGEVKSFDWFTPMLKKENLVYIGLRDLDRIERATLLEENIKIFTPYDIELKGGIGNVMNETLEYLKCDNHHNNPVMVSWDIDACDPSFIKGTGTKARCGLSEREAHFLLKRTFNTGNMVGLDMVEVNPLLEPNPNENREVLFGDNKSLSGTPTVVYAMEFILSGLGSRWL
jgi:arginase